VSNESPAVPVRPVPAAVIRRHDAAAWLLDLIGGPLPRWQMASLGWLFLVEVTIVCTVLCVVVLLWNWAMHEVPADQRRKTRS
jgi:hypothetical protein